MSDKIYTFKHKQIIDESNKESSKNTKNFPQYSYDYFKENSDEILQLQCICFSI